MSTHENSTLSLNQQKEKGKPSVFRKRILETLRTYAKPLTDRQIMDILRETDVNNIRPEITRLKQSNEIKECGKVKCEKTGKTVRIVRLKTPEEKTQPELY